MAPHAKQMMILSVSHKPFLFDLERDRAWFTCTRLTKTDKTRATFAAPDTKTDLPKTKVLCAHNSSPLLPLQASAPVKRHMLLPQLSSKSDW